MEPPSKRSRSGVSRDSSFGSNNGSSEKSSTHGQPQRKQPRGGGSSNRANMGGVGEPHPGATTHDIEAAAAAQVARKAAADCMPQPGPTTATAAAAAAVGLTRNGSSGSEQGAAASGSKMPGALASATSILQDLHPSLVPLVIAKSTTRKGKGGRQPASDPRLNPDLDPKKAKRILANRLSAARSKLKQKLVMEGLRAKHDVLVCQKQEVAKQLRTLKAQLQDVEAENTRLEAAVQTGEPVPGNPPPAAAGPSARCTPTKPPSKGGAAFVAPGSPLLAWDVGGAASWQQMEQLAC